MSAKTSQKELTFPCDPRVLHEIRSTVKAMWAEHTLPDRDGHLVTLAVDEALASIIDHARGTNRQGDIRITLDLDETRFKAVIEDFTNHCDSSGMMEAELRAHLENERKHQLGIFLMREIMDEVSYNFKKGFQNELTLVKFL
ncbi:MAG: ATP-binding protein [Planctomycetes bacterium]|nr:ATP-binding protein [Planctomycetota bacterium]